MVRRDGIGSDLVCFFLLVILAGCFPGDRDGEEIVVFAASSLNSPLQEIAVLFEEETGRKVVFNFAGSNVLAHQITASQPADIFLSANDHWMDYVEDAGAIHSATRRDLLTNRLVAICSNAASWSPVPGAVQLAELDFRFLCLGDPVAVPVGRYAKQWLSSLEEGGSSVWEAVSGRMSPASDVKAALAQTLSRKDTVGIVYWTDYLERKEDARILLESGDVEARYPIAITRSGMNKQPVGVFLQFIQSKIALDVFRSHGFGIAGMPESEE